MIRLCKKTYVSVMPTERNFNMAKVNLKGAFASEKIDTFGGICHGGSKSGTGRENGAKNASDICNFRILPSGELEKRNGFAPLMTLPGEPRAFWNGYIDGDEMSFALIGSTVYLIDLAAKSTEVIGSVSSAEGRAEFFFCRGVLYLVDGYDFYSYGSDGFSTFSGYVPLYGKEWKGYYASDEVYEPINYLSDKIRIFYKLTEDTSSLYIGVRCSEILSITKNDTYDILSSVALSEDGKRIVCSGVLLPAKSEIMVCLKLAPEEIRRSELIGVRRGTVYGGSSDGRMLLYAGKNQSDVFVSRSVSRLALSQSQDVDPDSTGVYFPVSDCVSISDGRYPVTAMCRHFDRLLIFTERETWMADFTGASEKPYIIPVNSGVGCFSEDGAVLGGNSPYSVSESGIYRWTSDDDTRNECNAVCISGPIFDMLDSSFSSHAVGFFLRARGEVWFADPDSDEQTVFIYSVSKNAWWRFDGIPVDRFFSYDGDAATLYGRYVFAFSDRFFVDTACDGNTQSMIEARYESNYLDFGCPERTKRLKRMLLNADCDTDYIDVTLDGDMGGTRTVKVTENNETEPPRDLDAHADIGRFTRMRFSITSDGVGRVRIRELTLAAQN